MASPCVQIYNTIKAEFSALRLHCNILLHYSGLIFHFTTLQLSLLKALSPAKLPSGFGHVITPRNAIHANNQSVHMPGFFWGGGGE